MEGWEDGRMGGWKDGRMEGWEDGRMGGWNDERMEALFSPFCNKGHALDNSNMLLQHINTFLAFVHQSITNQQALNLH